MKKLTEEHKLNLSKALKGKNTWLKGRKLSKEHRDKIRLGNLGTKRPPITEETRQKLRDRKKERKEKFGYINSPETRKKLSLSKKGFRMSENAKKKIGDFWRGKEWSKEKRVAIMSKLPRGAKSRFWKGGITPINTKVRNSSEYANWRKLVFERDNYTCVFCGIRGGKLNADHIKPFSLFPELRLDINNGRTLCVPCHKTTESFAGNFNKNKLSENLSPTNLHCF